MAKSKKSKKLNPDKMNPRKFAAQRAAEKRATPMKQPYYPKGSYVRINANREAAYEVPVKPSTKKYDGKCGCTAKKKEGIKGHFRCDPGFGTEKRDALYRPICKHGKIPNSVSTYTRCKPNPESDCGTPR
jgi:hypothetical protein